MLRQVAAACEAIRTKCKRQCRRACCPHRSIVCIPSPDTPSSMTPVTTIVRLACADSPLCLMHCNLSCTVTTHNRGSALCRPMTSILKNIIPASEEAHRPVLEGCWDVCVQPRLMDNTRHRLGAAARLCCSVAVRCVASEAVAAQAAVCIVGASPDGPARSEEDSPQLLAMTAVRSAQPQAEYSLRAGQLWPRSHSHTTMPNHKQHMAGKSLPREAEQEQGPGDEGPHQTLRPRGGRNTDASEGLAFYMHAGLRSQAADCAC